MTLFSQVGFQNVGEIGIVYTSGQQMFNIEKVYTFVQIHDFITRKGKQHIWYFSKSQFDESIGKSTFVPKS